MKIAFLQRGSFGHRAAISFFGKEKARDQGLIGSSNAEFVSKVVLGEAAYGIVPLENSVAGDVVESLKAIWHAFEAGARIFAVGEIFLAVAHHLIGHQNGKIENLKVIISHPQALEQCRENLRELNPGLRTMGVASTVEAVRLALENGDGSMAALASEEAAASYPSAKILASNLQDDPSNCTHFFVLSGHEVPASGADKTLALFQCDDKPGGLRRALWPLEKQGLNADMIGSVILRRTNDRKEYFFYLEFDGHRALEPAGTAIREMHTHCAKVHVIGSFPASPEVIR